MKAFGKTLNLLLKIAGVGYLFLALKAGEDYTKAIYYMGWAILCHLYQQRTDDV